MKNKLNEKKLQNNKYPCCNLINLLNYSYYKV